MEIGPLGGKPGLELVEYSAQPVHASDIGAGRADAHTGWGERA
jgi:hypothetical protein